MNYSELINEALGLFVKLEKASERKEKLALIEKCKENEFADNLLNLLKDESIFFEDFEMPVPNKEPLHLGNYLRFNTLIKKKDTVDAEVLRYAFGFFDPVEQKIYKTIFSKGISLPFEKPKEKERPKKEKAEEQAE